MSSTDVTSDTSAAAPEAGKVEFKLEVVVLPVADVDRAKAFYEMLGWRLDADLATADDYRIVQLTPPGSSASIHFGTGVTSAAPGSVERSVLVVDDVEVARAELVARGVAVSEVFHGEDGLIHHAGTRGRVAGPDPGRATYGSGASFEDPDGNGWLLQEITTRLPGRVGRTDMEIASLAELLLDTALHHDRFEKTAPPHDWWDWYAAYFDARQSGSAPDEASATADRYMAEVKNIVAS
jgi:catechol 2,3-dioxygenase-like lactoylglutathione lyase family enzyme